MLTPYEDYAREAVHGIFAPETTFTPQAGTWGLQAAPDGSATEACAREHPEVNR